MLTAQDIALLFLLYKRGIPFCQPTGAETAEHALEFCTSLWMAHLALCACLPGPSQLLGNQ